MTPAPVDPHEPTSDPDVTVMRDLRLVAKIWRHGPGQLRRAGHRVNEVLCEVPFANIVTFDANQDALLIGLVGRSPDVETFLFELELEGFRLVDGPVAPDLHRRRF